MEITRGDNKQFKLQRKDVDGNVIEVEADEMFFTVKYTQNHTEFLIQKKLSDGGIVFNGTDFYYRFELLPADTDNLTYGTYRYDVERIASGKKQTIAIGTFEITEEVTFASNEVEVA